MHPNSHQLMKEMLQRYTPRGLIYDIGSRNVNGTYRDLIPPDCQYEGLDIRPGDNVTHVVPEDGDWNYLPPANLIISGQCLEHVKRPWQWFGQVKSILKPNGRLLIVVPWKFYRHGPVDCWRVLPDGLRVLFEDAGFEVLEVGMREKDTFGAGRLKC